jgi:type II secretory pathway component PulF
MSYANPDQIDQTAGWRGVVRVLWHFVRPLLVVVVLLILFVGMLLMEGATVFTLLSGAGAFLIIVITTRAHLNAARRREAARIVHLLGQGVRLQVPLPAFLEVCALDETRRTARRIRSIGGLIESGSSIGDALRSELAALPDRQADLIRLSEANGTLGRTLKQVNAESTDSAGLAVATGTEREVSIDMARAYVAIVMIALVFVVGFLYVSVLPKFSMIFRDFGIRLPTAWTDMALFGVNYGTVLGLPVLLLSLAIISGILLGAVDAIFFPRRQQGRVKRVLAGFISNIPLLGAIRQNRDYGDACQVIADALAQHRPLDTAVRAAASMVHLSPNVADRLDSWGWFLHQGLSISQAARKARVRGLIVNFISDNATSPEVFQFLAMHFRTCADNRMKWLQAMVVYSIPILLGLAVGASAVALFKPIWGLIDVVGPYKVGL